MATFWCDFVDTPDCLLFSHTAMDCSGRCALFLLPPLHPLFCYFIMRLKHLVLLLTSNNSKFTIMHIFKDCKQEEVILCLMTVFELSWMMDVVLGDGCDRG